MLAYAPRGSDGESDQHLGCAGATALEAQKTRSRSVLRDSCRYCQQDAAFGSTVSNLYQRYWGQGCVCVMEHRPKLPRSELEHKSQARVGSIAHHTPHGCHSFHHHFSLARLRVKPETPVPSHIVSSHWYLAVGARDVFERFVEDMEPCTGDTALLPGLLRLFAPRGGLLLGWRGPAGPVFFVLAFPGPLGCHPAFGLPDLSKH